MARYAPAHQLELTEEVVPLDDPPASDRPHAAERTKSPRSQAATSESETPAGRSDALWVIEPGSCDAGADFNELADDELDAPAREPSGSTRAGVPGDTAEADGAEDAGSTQAAARAGLGTTRRWDSTGPRHPSPPVLAAPTRPGWARPWVLVVGLLGVLLAVLAVVGLSGRDGGDHAAPRAAQTRRAALAQPARRTIQGPAKRQPRSNRAHRRRHLRARTAADVTGVAVSASRVQSDAPTDAGSPAPARKPVPSANPVRSPGPATTPAAPSPPAASAPVGGGGSSGGRSSGGGSSSGGSSGGTARSSSHAQTPTVGSPSTSGRPSTRAGCPGRWPSGWRCRRDPHSSPSATGDA
jgi:hypothetical protein